MSSIGLMENTIVDGGKRIEMNPEIGSISLMDSNMISIVKNNWISAMETNSEEKTPKRKGRENESRR